MNPQDGLRMTFIHAIFVLYAEEKNVYEKIYGQFKKDKSYLINLWKLRLFFKI